MSFTLIIKLATNDSKALLCFRGVKLGREGGGMGTYCRYFEELQFTILTPPPPHFH